MASNTTGDPAGAASPDAAPQPENFPVIETPDDGDPLVADSVFEMGVADANHISWLKKPIARASQWVENLRTYRDARGHIHAKTDHFGLTHGSDYGWTEMWTPSGDFALTGPQNSQAGRWNPRFDSAGTSSVSRLPGVVANENTSAVARALNLTLDSSGAGHYGQFGLHAQDASTCFTIDTLARLSMHISPRTVVSLNWAHGFMANGRLINAIDVGAYFVRIDGGSGNWVCRTINGGAPTDVDSGVGASAGSIHSFEIYLVGSNLDDASTSRVLFLIDGALKANIVATLPINSPADMMMPVLGGWTTGSVANATLIAGPVRLKHITATATP